MSLLLNYNETIDTNTNNSNRIEWTDLINSTTSKIISSNNRYNHTNSNHTNSNDDFENNRLNQNIIVILLSYPTLLKIVLS